MTPAQIEEHARQRFNAVGDTFFSSAEIMNLIYAACLRLAQETQCIERVYTTSTVADQQEYAYPSSTISIKRVTYEGNKLEPVSFREDDALTLNNSTTTATGDPQYYSVWNDTLYLRPVPAGVGTLEIFAYNEPQAVTSTSSVEVPSLFHMDLVNFILMEMFAKDQNLQMSSYYEKKWEKAVADAKRWMKRRLRGDSFSAVKDEESLPITILGVV